MAAVQTHPFEGRVIAITGAGSGIGLATAHYLAARGASVSLADIQQSALFSAEESIRSQSLSPGAKILTTVLDVRQHSAVESWIARTISELGSLHGAANLAGIFVGGAGGLSEMSNDDWDRTIGINLTGVMYCLRAQMKVIEHGGSIVNASSVAGLVGSAWYPAYAASKHGVIGLTKSAAKEMGHRDVRVNCICPGRVDTEMMAVVKKIASDPNVKEQTWDTPIKRMAKPDEIAALIAFLLGDESRFMTGSAVTVDGGKIA